MIPISLIIVHVSLISGQYRVIRSPTSARTLAQHPLGAIDAPLMRLQTMSHLLEPGRAAPNTAASQPHRRIRRACLCLRQGHQAMPNNLDCCNSGCCIVQKLAASGSPYVDVPGGILKYPYVLKEHRAYVSCITGNRTRHGCKTGKTVRERHAGLLRSRGGDSHADSQGIFWGG